MPKPQGSEPGSCPCASGKELGDSSLSGRRFDYEACFVLFRNLGARRLQRSAGQTGIRRSGGRVVRAGGRLGRRRRLWDDVELLRVVDVFVVDHSFVVFLVDDLLVCELDRFEHRHRDVSGRSDAGRLVVAPQPMVVRERLFVSRRASLDRLRSARPESRASSEAASSEAASSEAASSEAASSEAASSEAASSEAASSEAERCPSFDPPEPAC